MKSLFLSLVLGLAVMLSPVAQASEHATPEEAKAMALKAAAYLKDVGPEKAFPAFDKDVAWHDRDLYVFVQDNSITVRAHGTLPNLIGRSFADLKDVDGKPFTREMNDVKTEGWVDYKWQDPVTKKVEPKKTYVVRVGDYVVCVGAYAG